MKEKKKDWKYLWMVRGSSSYAYTAHVYIALTLCHLQPTWHVDMYDIQIASSEKNWSLSTQGTLIWNSVPARQSKCVDVVSIVLKIFLLKTKCPWIVSPRPTIKSPATVSTAKAAAFVRNVEKLENPKSRSCAELESIHRWNRWRRFCWKIQFRYPQGARPTKLEKADILEMTVRYIELLHENLPNSPPNNYHQQRHQQQQRVSSSTVSTPQMSVKQQRKLLNDIANKMNSQRPYQHHQHQSHRGVCDDELPLFSYPKAENKNSIEKLDKENFTSDASAVVAAKQESMMKKYHWRPWWEVMSSRSEAESFYYSCRK